jgi:hypothetical protein
VFDFQVGFWAGQVTGMIILLLVQFIIRKLREQRERLDRLERRAVAEAAAANENEGPSWAERNFIDASAHGPQPIEDYQYRPEAGIEVRQAEIERGWPEDRF